MSCKTLIAFDLLWKSRAGTRTRRCPRCEDEQCPGRERRLWQHLRLILAYPARQSPETCSAPHPLLLRLECTPGKERDNRQTGKTFHWKKMSFSNTVSWFFILFLSNIILWNECPKDFFSVSVHNHITVCCPKVTMHFWSLFWSEDEYFIITCKRSVLTF